MPEQLSKEQKAAIDNYSKEIVTLKDYVTGVRKMPGMYCAGIGNRGFESLIREVYQNAIDQILKPEVPDKSVSISYNMQTLETTVSDHGLGLPFQDMERIITKPNTSKNYIKQKYQYSSGLHGAGLKVTNALSSSLVAKSYKYDGTAMQFETKDGYPVKGTNPKPIKNSKHLQGTTITFYPALDVLGECNLDWRLVYKRCRDILIRTPIGSVCDFTAIDENGVVHHETIKNDSGIVADLIDLTTIHKKLKSGKIESINNTLIKPIHIMNDNGDMRLECAFVFDGGDDDGPDPNVRISSYCNFCETKLGNHNDGTIDGICKWFTKYMNSIYLNSGDKKSKKKTISVVSSDIKTGLVISINAAVLEPIFVGQAKEQLSNPEMEPFCREVVMNGLDEWSKTNPKDLATLCKYFKDIAELRIKESSEKAKIVQKYASNVLTGYPKKFARPSEKEVDLFIVEGDR